MPVACMEALGAALIIIDKSDQEQVTGCGVYSGMTPGGYRGASRQGGSSWHWRRKYRHGASSLLVSSASQC